MKQDKTQFFKIGMGAEPLEPESQSSEIDIQELFVSNLKTLLEIDFLSAQYPAGETGEMDAVGIDEDHRPAIIEHKKDGRALAGQILEYGDWLNDNKETFRDLVSRKFGYITANKINWTARLVCVAAEFSKADQRLAAENRHIELIRYGVLDDRILMLERVTVDSGLYGDVQTDVRTGTKRVRRSSRISASPKFRERLDRARPGVKRMLSTLSEFLRGLGDDIRVKETRGYLGFSREGLPYFVYVYPGINKIALHADLNPSKVNMEEGFTRDTRALGHWGRCALNITVRSDEDLEKAKPLLERAYRNPAQGAQVALGQSGRLPSVQEGAKHSPSSHAPHKDEAFQMKLARVSPAVRKMVSTLSEFLHGLGGYIMEKETPAYLGFSRGGRSYFVRAYPGVRKIVLHADLNPDEINLEEGFTRDTRHLGYWGRCALQIDVRDDEDLERAKPLLARAYRESG